MLAKDIKRKGKVICSAKEPCLDKKQINKLKKHKVRSVLIKLGIPFVPALFIAVGLSIAVYYIF